MRGWTKMNTKAARDVEQDAKLHGRRHRGRERERGDQGRREVPDHDGSLQCAFERQTVEELQKQNDLLRQAS